ncbi:MAG: DUF5606 domain-containing protein [Saprospiraceae bacterium]|nr:DUF5606 domain-containing protein [Saprospiraceae bacterium]
MIDVQKFVAVSGKTGVFKLVAVRNNGIIIEDLDSKVRSFTATNQMNFSPFETVQIFTNTAEDVTTLAQVFTNMKSQKEAFQVPSEKSASSELRAYFTAVVPEHDQARVHISDIKKIIKWFSFLDSRDLLKEKIEEKVEGKVEQEESDEEKIEEIEEKIEEETEEEKEKKSETGE